MTLGRKYPPFISQLLICVDFSLASRIETLSKLSTQILNMIHQAPIFLSPPHGCAASAFESHSSGHHRTPPGARLRSWSSFLLPFCFGYSQISSFLLMQAHAFCETSFPFLSYVEVPQKNLYSDIFSSLPLPEFLLWACTFTYMCVYIPLCSHTHTHTHTHTYIYILTVC